MRRSAEDRRAVINMCGIAGYLNLNCKPLDPDEQFLQPMLQSIAHRGPDDQGKMILGPVALGMVRLSIIDLKSGRQPISNENGSVWIVFNGEIYNFQELREKLLARGHRLSTKTDTEVIVHLYEEYGPECLRFLEGMFAFALWDHERQRLLLARDRMGEKPLHWAIFANQFLFSSELKGILSHPASRKELNLEAMQKYLALEYVPSPHCIFKGIEKLLPGHYLIVENGQVKIHQYWEPEALYSTLSFKEAEEKLVSLLDESTRLRLISDVPLGVFLSGGIDSSSIAALTVKNRKQPLKTFSVAFADSSFDESKYAQQVALHLGTEHQVAVFDSSCALSTLEELFEVLDEPLADASIIPTYFLSRMARKEVTVALAGEGGDELFGGYPTYQAHRIAQLWEYLPSLLKQKVLEPAIRNLPVSLNNLSIDFKAKRFIASAAEPPILRHLHWMGAIPVNQHPDLLKPEALVLTNEKDIYPGLELESCSSTLKGSNGNDLISRIMHLDMVTYLPDDLLVKSDRASMAASLEVRLPFLAFPLVEFALSLPSHFKVRGLTTKYLLKRAMAQYLPKNILQRPKKGFGIPIAKWLRHEFKPLVADLLNPQFIEQQGLFSWNHIKNLLAEHESQKYDRRKELWALLIFQKWWYKFFAA